MPKKYETVSGDAWDMIAYKVYGGEGAEKMMHLLLEANPAHRETVIFSAGIVLSVPDAVKPVSSLLPPWKRRNAT